MKKYIAKFNPNRKGVYAVSLVDEPAMEGDFIRFQKENVLKFAQVDVDKRRVMGLILEPNKEVLRFDKEDDSYYTVQFGVQDIEDVAYNFQKQGNQNNSTIQHDGKSIEGVSFVETWIVENPKIDKSTNFGFEYPKGSWMGVMQLDNKEVWNEYVQTGKVKGFSIDAFMQFEEINLNKLNMSEIKEDSILNAIKDGFTQLKETLIPKKVEEVVELKEEVIELAEDMPVMDAPAEDAPAVDEKVNEEEVIKKMIADLQGLLDSLSSANVELSKKVDGLELKFTKQEENLIELGKQPATKSVKSAPSQVDFTAMSEWEKRQYHKQKNG